MEEGKNKDIPVGWNDPPLFSYNDTIAHVTSGKRTTLNKRVPFVGSTAQCTTSSVDPTLPPSTSLCAPPPARKSDEIISTSASKIVNNNDYESSYTNKVDTLQLVMDNLQTIIDQKEELVSDKVKKQLILKKIDIMKSMWLDDKLLPDIHKEMLKLSTLLKDGNKEKANQIQIGLMVDHPRFCSMWIPAIRQLINL